MNYMNATISVDKGSPIGSLSSKREKNIDGRERLGELL